MENTKKYSDALIIVYNALGQLKASRDEHSILTKNIELLKEAVDFFINSKNQSVK